MTDDTPDEIAEGTREREAPVWRRALERVATAITGRFRTEIRSLPAEPWVPQVPHDPTFAADFYAGRPLLGGVRGEGDPLAFDGPPSWQAAFHGFGWLRPLRDENTPLARARAQAVLREWLERFGSSSDGSGNGPSNGSSDDSGSSSAWETDVTAARLDAWLTHADLLTDEAEPGLRDAWRSAVSRHVALLRRRWVEADAVDRTRIATVLVLAGGASARHVPREVVVAPTVMDEPAAALLLWSRLERSLRMEASTPKGWQGQAEALATELATALSGLRLRSHSDASPSVAEEGGRAFARFAGRPVAGARLSSRLLYRLAERADGEHAPGLHRRERDGTVLLADARRAPTAGAFELADAAGRLMGSCGAVEGPEALRQALAEPQAHSMTTLGGAEWRNIEVENGEALRVVREGEGVRHERQLELTAEGLNGTETVRTGRATRVTIRFHCDPNVRAEGKGPGVRLVRPKGQAWTLFCIDATVSLADSALFREGAPEREAVQVVLTADVEGDAELRWALVPDARA